MTKMKPVNKSDFQEKLHKGRLEGKDQELVATLADPHWRPSEPRHQEMK